MDGAPTCALSRRRGYGKARNACVGLRARMHRHRQTLQMPCEQVSIAYGLPDEAILVGVSDGIGLDNTIAELLEDIGVGGAG